MSKLWDDLKENMKDWSTSAVEKAEEMSRIAMAKTEEMTRISKIRFEIHQLQREMTKAYEKLGRLAYSHTKQDHMATFSGNTEFFEIVTKVENIKEEIKLKKDEIEKIKLEYGIDENEIQSDVNKTQFGKNKNLDMEKQTN
jgi:predicted nuclease with TOPRIM domain